MAIDQRSFTEFKKEFYEKFPDLSVFECGEVNLLKVVLDGLKVNYAERFPVRTPVFSSLRFHQLYLFLQRIRSKKEMHENELRKAGGKKIWCVDFEGKTIAGPEGVPVSFYYHSLKIILREENAAVMNGSTVPSYASDFSFAEMLLEKKKSSLSNHDISLRNQLKKTFRCIQNTGKLSPNELKSVQIAFQHFFDNYRGWNGILQYAKPDKVLFIMHYHREGFLFAMKKNGVRTVELQHGLIAPQDIFYVFPSQVKPISQRALFADCLLVYGKYWKEVLLNGSEYDDSNIHLLGYYAHEANSTEAQLSQSVRSFIHGKKTALICTQTFMTEEYVELVQRLSKLAYEKKWNCVFLVKPHPNEKLSDYSALKDLSNVRTIQEPLAVLMKNSCVHFSVYSTTHFDAVRFGIKSFLLPSIKYGDYVKGIASSGIAAIYDFDSDPFCNSQNIETKPDRGYYYESFDASNFSAEKLMAIL